MSEFGLVVRTGGETPGSNYPTVFCVWVEISERCCTREASLTRWFWFAASVHLSARLREFRFDADLRRLNRV